MGRAQTRSAQRKAWGEIPSVRPCEGPYPSIGQTLMRERKSTLIAQDSRSFEDTWGDLYILFYPLPPLFLPFSNTVGYINHNFRVVIFALEKEGVRLERIGSRPAPTELPKEAMR